jgi:pimeloyl-ACP methyl ester carboxylesterase
MVLFWRARPTPTPQHVVGEGTPLVLLHGIGGTWEIWEPVLPFLEPFHTVIAVTLPGHHGGPRYSGGGDATVASIADQLVTMLRAQGIERAHVAGNSLGGWLSMELARRGFANSVVALSPAGGWRTDRDYLSVARAFRVFYSVVDGLHVLLMPFIRFDRVRKALMRQTMERGDRIPPSKFGSLLQAMACAHVIPGLLRTMRRDGPVKPLDVSDIPVRIAWGECDRVIPFERYGRPFVERIRGAELITLPALGHVPVYDDPDLVAATILSVTQRADAAARAPARKRSA